ncbi:hypothetical protein JOE21_001340 [Desmospora profundinema]|uniref:Uncharacterized protein n=1 Tax=Desmospora profundinema TaxID=1571184 RepID=A0ABU1IKM9_9BACL|nr:hypothetical protein [Desmospora profundinema]
MTLRLEGCGTDGKSFRLFLSLKVKPLFYLFLFLTVTSLFLAWKWKKPLLLTIPFFSLFVYTLVQIAMVPMGFFETLKFIFSLR